MTPYQLRMARACLNLTVRELELRTGVNKNTVSRYEAAQEVLASAVLKLEAYFRQEGLAGGRRHAAQKKTGGICMRHAKTEHGLVLARAVNLNGGCRRSGGCFVFDTGFSRRTELTGCPVGNRDKRRCSRRRSPEEIR